MSFGKKVVGSLALALAVGCAMTRGDDVERSTAAQTPATGGAFPSGHPRECPDTAIDVTHALSGYVTADDLPQNGWFVSHVNPPNTPPDQAYEPPTCESPHAMSAITDEDADLHFDAFRYHNWTGADACVSIEVIMSPFPGGGNGELRTAAYLDGFYPDDITKNYLADTGGGTASVYSVNVPKDHDVVVVITGKSANGDPLYRGYLIEVAGCGTQASTGTADAGTTTDDDAGTPPEPSDDGGSSGKAW